MAYTAIPKSVEYYHLSLIHEKRIKHCLQHRVRYRVYLYINPIYSVLQEDLTDEIIAFVLINIFKFFFLLLLRELCATRAI